MNNPVDITQWFAVIDDRPSGYLMTSNGVLLMLFNWVATDPNEKSIKVVNAAIQIAKQNGYSGDKMLKQALGNPNVTAQMLAEYVNQISPYLGNRTVIQLIEDL